MRTSSARAAVPAAAAASGTVDVLQRSFLQGTARIPLQRAVPLAECAHALENPSYVAYICSGVRKCGNCEAIFKMDQERTAT
jgi:hypothetical protein